jgi:hypothetical protein
MIDRCNRIELLEHPIKMSIVRDFFSALLPRMYDIQRYPKTKQETVDRQVYLLVVSMISFIISHANSKRVRL